MEDPTSVEEKNDSQDIYIDEKLQPHGIIPQIECQKDGSTPVVFRRRGVEDYIDTFNMINRILSKREQIRCISHHHVKEIRYEEKAGT